jgi:uncharacterized protein YjbI with pentapeptide repeats
MAYNPNKLTNAEIQRITAEFKRQEELLRQKDEENLAKAIAELERNEKERVRQEEKNLAQAIAESERNEKQRVRQEEERERQEEAKRKQEEARRSKEEAKRSKEEERVRQDETRVIQEEQNLADAIAASLQFEKSSSGVGSTRVGSTRVGSSGVGSSRVGSSGESSSGASSSGASSSGASSSGESSSGASSSGASSSGASSSGASSSGASSSGASSSIISEISEIKTELMKSRQTITMYNDKLTYLRTQLPILKIPIFVHYNNLAFYSISANNVKACSFKYKSEDIYLVSQYVLFDDMEDKKLCPNLEFRPNAFYMKQQSSYAKGKNLYFYGKLEIYNIKTKNFTKKDSVEVHSHDGTFSPRVNLLSFDELQINKDSGESFIYYVVFTPIDRPDLPIFKGFYWLQMMPDEVIDKPCYNILREIQTALLPLKGGNYLQLKHKSKLHKSKLYKSKLHKSKLYKSKLHKSKLHKSKFHKSKLHKTKFHKTKLHKTKLYKTKL